MNEPPSQRPASAPKRKRHLWGRGVAGLFLALMAAIAYTAFNLPPMAEPALPNPNGYIDLVRAGKQLVGEPLDATNFLQLRVFVNRNDRALALARQGLRRACRVPPMSRADWLANHAAQLVALKRLAWAIRTQARLAEAEGRFDEAAQHCLDCVRLGQQISHGGALIDRLVGFAVEDMGLYELGNIGTRLNSHDRAQTVRTLASLEAAQEPVSEAFACERAWQQRSFPLTQRLAALLEFRRMRRIGQMFSAKDQAIRSRFDKVRHELEAPPQRDSAAAHP